uniref:IFN-gamma n=1 Tax=Anguilla japonica TaxID=7937 RepID=A0A1D9CIY6_ANGJA|nr:IFN-gamma precursor [Anguilla japonica]
MNPLWSLTLIFMLGSLALSSSEDTISQKMTNDVNRLKRHYKTSDIALRGPSLFPKDLGNFTEEEQSLVLQESLDVYIRILSDMLRERNISQEREIENSIKAIRAQIVDLRISYFHAREQALKKQLEELWALKTHDKTTQRKAIRDLLTVFQSATRLGSRIQKKAERRRRRRQTPGGRVPQP